MQIPEESCYLCESMDKFGLIGHPLAGSGSPALFEKAYGGRWRYDLIEGADFELSWQKFLSEYQAINITAPFKELAFRKLMENGVLGGPGSADTSEEAIRAIGAVNIAVKEGDGLVHGYNSDYLGVLQILRKYGFGPDSTVVVAGFGGAGKAAAAASRALGCDTIVCNRTRHTQDIRPLDELPILAPVADLLVYTLAFPVPELGLETEETAMPLPPAILEANYRTPCLSGLPGYIPGTEWLAAQAETGYPLMTGCPPLQS